jgi:hypothetical protein
MSLSLPSETRRGAASAEASDNLQRLMRIDARGSKNQVATQVALDCLHQIDELQPGYFAGVKSWAKAGCVYALGGAAAVGAIGLTGAALYEAGSLAIQNGYGLQMAATGAAFLSTGWIASELGYKPLGALTAFLAVAVRDAANRAANWSVKADERSLAEKQNEAKACHQTILQQMTLVYNDNGKKLREMCAAAQTGRCADELLKTLLVAIKLEERLPNIQKLMRQFKLADYEIAQILQGLKDSIRYVESQSCQLKIGRADWNTDLLLKFPVSMIDKVVIPLEIQDRMAEAQSITHSMLDRIKGCGSAIVTGGETLAGLTALAGVAALGFTAYYLGSNEAIAKAGELFSSLGNGTLPSYISAPAAMAGAAAIVVPSALVGAAKCDHLLGAIDTDNQHAAQMRDRLKQDLKAIYSGVELRFQSLSSLEQQSAASHWADRLPLIKKALKNQGFDPAEIVGGLEAAVKKEMPLYSETAEPGAPVPGEKPDDSEIEGEGEMEPGAPVPGRVPGYSVTPSAPPLRAAGA